MKKPFFYSRAFILTCSILLTAVSGAVLMSYQLKKSGKSNLILPLILIIFITNFLLVLFVNYLIPSYYQWNLNKTIGWGDLEVPYFVRVHRHIFEYFIPNIILGLALAYPIYNKYLGKFPTDKIINPKS